jgi:cytochrome P450
VLCELLGVPVPDREWILASVLAYGSPDRPGESQRVTRELAAYLTGLIAARRAGPGDDLLSALVRARDSAAEEVPPARVRRAG